jgi:hypothetical protein
MPEMAANKKNRAPKHTFKKIHNEIDQKNYHHLSGALRGFVPLMQKS